jgi:hypothetical protein
MIYFVIRKYKSEYSEDYRIEKHSNSHAEANKFLAALSLLEENENVEFFGECCMKYKGTTDIHFEIKKAGSIVLFEPLTEWASEWWEENVEDSQMIGGAYAVEHRYAEDIATGITEALT